MSAKNARIRIATGCLVTLLVTAGAALAQSQSKPVETPLDPVTLEVPPVVAADPGKPSTNTATHWFRKDFVLFPPAPKAPADKTAGAQPATPAVQAPATVENLRRPENP